MSNYRFWLVVIILITIVTAWINLPDNPGIHINLDGEPGDEISADFVTVQGLDLQGGSRVLLAPSIDQFDPDQLSVASDVIENRVNGLGLSETVVQVQNNDTILVELPGVFDEDVALDTVKSTALLEFVRVPQGSEALFSGENVCIYTTEQARLDSLQTSGDTDEGTSDEDVDAEPSPTPIPPDEATPEPIFGKTIPNSVGNVSQEDGERGPCPDGSFPQYQQNGQPFETIFTGERLDSAAAIRDQFGQWIISFELDSEGGDIFADYTTANTGTLLAIVLDGEVISAPRINSPITGGSGQIEGSFTQEEANLLEIQLQYGSLPIPLEVSAFENVGPTLGEISVQRSLRAGIIGVVVVLLFMMIYYRVPGIAAALALLVFASINFAIYKSIPVTITLPAITGFLISIGTAVDGNILIFERMKEELRAGRSLNTAVELGFDRAWTSIRDSNFSTLLICGVLFFFGGTFGANVVQGFAITLGLGLIINLFTAIIVTRTFLTTMLNWFGERLEGNKTLLGA